MPWVEDEPKATMVIAWPAASLAARCGNGACKWSSGVGAAQDGAAATGGRQARAMMMSAARPARRGIDDIRGNSVRLEPMTLCRHHYYVLLTRSLYRKA